MYGIAVPENALRYEIDSTLSLISRQWKIDLKFTEQSFLNKFKDHSNIWNPLN